MKYNYHNNQGVTKFGKDEKRFTDAVSDTTMLNEGLMLVPKIKMLFL